MIGVYTITSLVNNKIYVGCATNMTKREGYHFRRLLLGKHNNRHLQNTFNKYGKENLVFEPLVECLKEHLPSEEHYWANLLNAHEQGFNIRPTNPNNYNKNTISQEGRRRISEANKGRKHTPEMLAHLSRVKKGRPCHPNTYKAVLEGKNRYKFTPKDCAAGSLALQKRIAQYDKTGKLIKEYDSGTIAEQETGFKRQQLYNCANGNQKHSHGFVWKYI